MTPDDIPDHLRTALKAGLAIPAHPLALHADRTMDTRRQRALTRYYLDAGCGGLAVGVHTTQFAIRDVGLYEPVLELAAQTVADWPSIHTHEPRFMVAGVAGRTEQAVDEAQVARSLGYHAVLVSPAPFKNASEDDLQAHVKAVGREMPVIGFYLQTAVGGRPLSMDFWRRFAELPSVIGIKIAPFHRHRTIDVVRGVIEARAEDRVTLYTGNDDHIVSDLAMPFTMRRDGKDVTVRIAGGLLGQWSVHAKAAVDLLADIHAAIANGADVPARILALDSQMTDMNAAVFDVANDFHGVIAGCHEILRRQGLLEGIWCLDPHEGLSPGQAEELTRVTADYPHLTDDAFVAANLNRWLTD